MAIAQRKPQEAPQSLMDFVAAHDGRLPEELSAAMKQSSREAFLRLRERLGK
ncbi:hypothetical protein JHL17_20255 [Azospirillum sp. YIM B02556]|uniref:Uncharacterized protein n=1 Tax=Azospirillum endophyticum TaxID=2800326 RepID=A0ABS1F8J0_9PROT|nr:hypothetical protein [Azospirillum endophyticum]MBK1839743.1 hypothetical protein [Azospirillum endophyticum]